MELYCGGGASRSVSGAERKQENMIVADGNESGNEADSVLIFVRVIDKFDQSAVTQIKSTAKNIFS